MTVTLEAMRNGVHSWCDLSRKVNSPQTLTDVAIAQLPTHCVAFLVAVKPRELIDARVLK